MDFNEIINRLKYHPGKEEDAAKFDALRESAINFAQVVYDLCPDNREKSLAITKLEEALQWSIGSIVRY